MKSEFGGYMFKVTKEYRVYVHDDIFKEVDQFVDKPMKLRDLLGEIDDMGLDLISLSGGILTIDGPLVDVEYTNSFMAYSLYVQGPDRALKRVFKMLGGSNG